MERSKNVSDYREIYHWVFVGMYKLNYLFLIVIIYMITYCRNGSIFYDNHYKRTDLLLGWLIIFQYKNISCMIKWLDLER